MPGAEHHSQAWVLEPERLVAMLGTHGRFAYLDRANDLMVVGLSSFPDQADALLTVTLQQLWTQITELTAGRRDRGPAPLSGASRTPRGTPVAFSSQVRSGSGSDRVAVVGAGASAT